MWAIRSVTSEPGLVGTQGRVTNRRRGAWQPGNLRVDRLGRRVAAADAGQANAIGSAAAQGCSAAYSRVPVEAVGGISQRDVQQ